MAGDSRRIIGAVNPSALPELRAGRRIDWQSEVVDKMLAQLLAANPEIKTKELISVCQRIRIPI
jgi:hypothetical protein